MWKGRIRICTNGEGPSREKRAAAATSFLAAGSDPISNMVLPGPDGAASPSDAGHSLFLTSRLIV